MDFMDARANPERDGHEFIIEKMHFAGKWVEFWHQGLPPREMPEHMDQEADSWQACCKSYKLWACVEKAELYDHIYNFGFRGMVVSLDEHGDPKAIRVGDSFDENDNCGRSEYH